MTNDRETLPSPFSTFDDTRVSAHNDEFGSLTPEAVVKRARTLRQTLQGSFRDEAVKSIYAEAERVARRASRQVSDRPYDLDQRIDRIVTSPIFGLPLMLLILATVFWLTITGANYPSQMLAKLLFALGDLGAAMFDSMGLPWWITGFVWHGVYRGLAWVIAVMLPPMAIFFPLFTILEDFGYLPRVAFNLDFLFRKAGAHGKQALTMAMGFGCNAAGIVATRIINSPRERLVAILTNNFVPCNGRFPTLIMLATIFVAAAFPARFASFAAAGAVVSVVLIGVVFTLGMSWLLTRTILKGEASAFTLELPPYRRPGIGRILYTSLIDRTVFVLWRAVLTAVPAGGVIWILGNVYTGDVSLAEQLASAFDPLGRAVGLDGVIMLAYLIAIPANEIVVPTMLMVYMGIGMMSDLESFDTIRVLLVDQHGWTMLTAVNLMLFSLLHNPCATTIITIYKETLSRRWTVVGALMPLGLAFLVTFLTATIVRFLDLI
jgi:ferrous iron transport protein B